MFVNHKIRKDGTDEILAAGPVSWSCMQEMGVHVFNHQLYNLDYVEFSLRGPVFIILKSVHILSWVSQVIKKVFRDKYFTLSQSDFSLVLIYLNYHSWVIVLGKCQLIALFFLYTNLNFLRDRMALWLKFQTRSILYFCNWFKR